MIKLTFNFLLLMHFNLTELKQIYYIYLSDKIHI